MTAIDPPFRQLVTARFSGGTTPRIAWPADTLAGSDLLFGVLYSLSASSTITTDVASTNPTSPAWPAPIATPSVPGASGLTFRLYRLAAAAQRFARDAASGATFYEQLIFNVSTNSDLVLAELDDILALDVVGGSSSGSGTTLAAPAIVTAAFGEYVLGFHAHRNVDDQTASAPAVFPDASGAGNPVPIGATLSPNQVSLAVTLTLPGAAASSVAPTTTITPSARNWLALGVAFKSVSRAQPKHGVIGSRTIKSAGFAPVMLGGSKRSLVGVRRTYSWPAILNGPEALAPVVTGLLASGATQSTIDLAFDVNPGNLATTLRIDYTQVLGADGQPNWLVGFSRTPIASPLAAGTDVVHVQDSLSDLAAGTTWYWRVVAINTAGETDSSFAVFGTLSLPTAPPLVTTGSAVPVVATAATLTGSINPENLPTSYYFRFGTSPTLVGATSTTTQLLAAVDAAAHGVAAAITGLVAGTTYYFQLHAANAAAPEASGGIDGAIVSFSTPAAATPPIVTTGTPSTTKATQLVVPGSVDPNGAATTWKAQASTDGFASVAAETSAVALPDSTAGNVQPVSGTITGLAPNTPYTTRIVATNSSGTTNGTASGSISTEKIPAVGSPSTLGVTDTTVTMFAQITNQAGISGGVIVSTEYGLTTAYGSAAAGSPFTLGAAPDPASPGAVTSGLVPSTLYHFRVNAQRADGDGAVVHSADGTFTTSASVAIPTITTPSAHGPSVAIPTGQPTATTPTYHVQVKSDGTLKRSDTSAAVTIAGTSFLGGTLIIESDTPGTLRQPNTGLLDQLRVHAGTLILRELLLHPNQGQIETTSSPSGNYGIRFEGCALAPGATSFNHFRAVDCNGGGILLTKSPSGVYCGHRDLTTPWSAASYSPDPYNPVLTPELRLDNFTAHPHAAATGYPMLTVDAALNVALGGFDCGTLCTPAFTPTWAVRLDAALRSGGIAADVQDVYIDAALDATVSILHNPGSGTGASLRAGTLKRSGVWAAQSPNTSGSRPFRPLWFELANGTQPGSETSGNCTNDQVLAEHFVNRNWFTQSTVNATMRDGSTIAQVYEVCCEVYDPAVALALWTPDDLASTWPNGARRFITIDGVKRTFGPRPTLPATMPDATAYQNKAQIDGSWTHMGGTAGDGVTEIKDVVFDPDTMVDTPGGSAGTKRFSLPDFTKTGAQVIVAPNASQLGGVAVTLDATTPKTLKVTAPGGGAPDLSKWSLTKNQRTITTISNATPPVASATSHGYNTGDRVLIAGSSVAAYNAEWTVTKLTANTFSLNGGTASGAGTGGSALARKDIFGIYSGYADANLGPNAVAAGIGYRRQLSYTGIDTVAGAFTGVLLIPGPTSTPEKHITESPTGVLGGDILKIVSGVCETFYSHGLPTGDQVTVQSVPGLAVGPYTVTRIDAFHFLLQGQTGFSWTPGTQVVGTYTPTTAHAYGLAGAQTSFAIPAGTTLDSTEGSNMSQPANNTQLNIAAGARLRFIRCAFRDISINLSDSTAFVEVIDCDHSVTPLPGRYDYDSPGNLGVTGTYDRFNQHLPSRIQVTLNVFSASSARIRLVRMVLTGAHGDVLPGQWGAGSEWNEVYIDQASPAGTNNDGESNVRPGILAANGSMVAHLTHGDIAQFFDNATALMRKCRFATQGHSVTFTRLGDHYEAHNGMALAQYLLDNGNPSGFYKATLVSGEQKQNGGKGFQNVNAGDAVLLKNAGSLNGLWTITAFVDKVVVAGKATYNSIEITAPYPASGNPATCDMAHPVQVRYPGILRCRFATPKFVDSSDTTRLQPVLSKGNVTISVTTAVGSSPTQPIDGELDFRLIVYDSGLDNGGGFTISNPSAITPPHPEWIDLGTPNRNGFTVYSNTGVPAQVATPNLISPG